MDADDVCEPARLERQRDLMESDSSLAVCGTGVRYFPREAVRDGARRYEAWLNEPLGPGDARAGAVRGVPPGAPHVLPERRRGGGRRRIPRRGMAGGLRPHPPPLGVRWPHGTDPGGAPALARGGPATPPDRSRLLPRRLRPVQGALPAPHAVAGPRGRRDLGCGTGGEGLRQGAAGGRNAGFSPSWRWIPGRSARASTGRRCWTPGRGLACRERPSRCGSGPTRGPLRTSGTSCGAQGLRELRDFVSVA